MQQYQCLLVANECYQRGRMMTPTKIVVHSTAANNTSISRYVQPAPGQTAGFELKGGPEWQDVTVALPVKGRPRIVRLYLPAAQGPVEIASVRFAGADGKPAREWVFGP